jgi:hypothetical protein
VKVAPPLHRHETIDADHSLGSEAIELAARGGLVLDEAQQIVVRSRFARVPKSDRWAHFEIGVVEPRQNGKGSILETCELGEVELLPGGRLIIHSAHEYATALEAFYRMLSICEEAGVGIAKVRNAHGEQGIDFANGTRLRYRTRTRGGGRGFSCDLLELDEAMSLPEFAQGALLPTLSARPNAQVIYAGSAVDQRIHEHGRVLARVRERGIAGEERLAYFEWGLDYPNPDSIPGDVIADPKSWAKANPAYGVRISREAIDAEQRSMAQRTFAVERLGVGDWPATDAGAGVIELDKWHELTDVESEIRDPICLAYDVSPERVGSLAASGRNDDGFVHVEIVDQRAGTAWLPKRLVELAENHGPVSIVTDSRGPGASLIPEIREALFEAGYELTEASGAENAQACGLLVDAVEERTLRHLGDQRIEDAIRGAATRPVGDAFAWARRTSSVNISALCAITLALWATMGCPDDTRELVIY